MATPPARRGTRNQKACTTCRQAKLRCDNAQTFPKPCSRCQQKSLQCRIDPDFKRVGTRHRLEEVTSQLNAIQRSLEYQIPPPSRDPTRAVTTPTSTSLAAGVYSPPSGSDLNSFEFYRYSDSSDIPYAAALPGHSALEASQIQDLFAHFKIHYYHHCPILDTSISIAELHQYSQILFWTIIMISSRWHPSLSRRHKLLLESYRNLLSGTFITPFHHSLESIQAILLICIWPLAVPRQVDDPTWNYCGLVTNAAVRMGINRLDLRREGSNLDKGLSIKNKTWMACIQVNCQSVNLSSIKTHNSFSKSYGWNPCGVVSPEILNPFRVLPPTTIFDGEFTAKTELFRVYAKSSPFISDLNGGVNSWSFVQGLCKDLENVRQSHKASWTTGCNIIMRGLQIFLYILQLEHAEKNENSSQLRLHDRDNDTSRRNFINLTYVAAGSLIDDFSEVAGGVSDSPEPHAPIPQRYLPKHFFGILVLAMAFLFKVKIMYEEEITSRRENVETHVRQVYQILSVWSAEKLDEPGRVLRLMEVVTRAEKQCKLEMDESRSDGRPGVTLLDDFISAARAIRESEAKRTQAGESQNTTLGETSEQFPFVEGLGDELDIQGLQDPLLNWNFPWGLDLSSTDQFDFGTSNLYPDFV